MSSMQNVYHRKLSDVKASHVLPDGTPLLRVGGASPVRGLAGSIAHALRQHEQIVLRAIGASAVNQAVKAVALARTYLAAEGMEIGVIPSIQDVDMEGYGRSAVEMVVRRV
ncbi:MAG: stage V sporulation protein S [Caldilineaceae bacterium]